MHARGRHPVGLLDEAGLLLGQDDDRRGGAGDASEDVLLVGGQESAEAPAGVHVEVEVEHEPLPAQPGGECHGLRQEGVRAVRVQHGAARRGQERAEEPGRDRGVGELGGAVPAHRDAVLPGPPRRAAGAERGGHDADVVALGEAARQVQHDALEAAEVRG